MSCSSCKNLDTKKKADGAVSGAKYFCKKLKTYVSGDYECPKYEKCSRDSDTCNKIYREGRDYDSDTNSAGFYIVIAVILLIITILVRIFKPELF